MTWADFVSLVNEHLPIEAQRRGIREAFNPRMMRNAVLDLQRYIVAYQKAHTTTYQASDLTEEGMAMRGTIPSGGIPQAFYIYKAGADSDGEPYSYCKRNRLDFWPWNDRQFLTCDHCSPRLYAYTISPQAKTFIVRPKLSDDTRLQLIWNGLKQDFVDGDEVPFPSQAAEAVADYVKWKVGLLIDKNVTLALESQKSYLQLRQALYLEERERTSAEKKDEFYADAISPVANTYNSGFRADITSWAELGAIPVSGYQKPVIFGWVESGTNIWHTTQLRAGTDATDTANGIQRPVDYGSDNEFVWYEV